MTSTTTLNITLTQELQDTLNAGGANAYAVTFDSAGTATLTTLMTGATGAPPATADVTVPLSLTLPIDSGKVYFVVQSPLDGTLTDLTTVITGQSDINWQTAQANNFRYDSFEFDLENSSFDAGNLTSVEGFGLPMSVGVTYQDGSSASLGYDVTGEDIFAGIAAASASAVFPYTASTPGLTGDRAALSPSQSVGIGNSAFSADDWNGYITALQQTDTATGKPYADAVEFAGFVDGTVDVNNVYHNGGFYSYTLQWDEGNGVFWLAPDANSQIQGYIAITPDQLANNIYATEGYVEIYASQADYATGTPYIIYLNSYTYIDEHGQSVTSTAYMNAGADNQWGDVVKQLLTGFTAGFYGVTGSNKQGEDVDLDQNWNWDPTFSFGNNLVSGQNPTFYDHYSAYFFAHSNSYGSGYSDQLMSYYDQGGPLISLYDPGLSGSVSTIDITIFDDDETPTGYTPTVIYNYVDPGASGFTAPTYSTSSASNIVLSFTNGAMVLDESKAKITVSFQTGDTASPWASVTLDGTSGTLWQNWDITQNADGTYSAVAQSPAVSQPVGTLLLGNLPVADSGVSWYQIEVSKADGAFAKTFNLYTTNSGSQFLDPNYTGQAGAIAIDGLATINADPSQQYVDTFTVNFLYATTTTVDPHLLAQVNSNLVPSSVVVGQVTATDPSASPGSTGFTALAGQDALDGNAVTTDDAQLGFGWTGLTSGTNMSSWISGYTNRVDGQSVALVTVAGSHQGPVAITADVDGQWVSDATETLTLSEGTYTITMQQYAASDTGYAHPLTAVSSAMTVTVQIDELDLAASASGSGASLVDDGSGTPGNWIRLEASGAGLPHGTRLVAYAVDADGEMVSRDGLETGSQVTLDDAILGHLGVVTSDSGAPLISGDQSVYLRTGLELRFATIDSAGTVDLDPDVQTTDLSDGGVQFLMNGLAIEASIDNSLSDTAMLAGNQRDSDTAWVHLDHGEVVQLEITGSCGNTNTLGFVRIDVDPSTGGWSVDGVAYGDTDAFHSAVTNALDDGFIFQDGGSFHADTQWTVAGDSGYYAPVLLTQGGDVFVIGGANEGGHEQILMFGENTFGIEDLSASAGSDFDYNDMVVRISYVNDYLL